MVDDIRRMARARLRTGDLPRDPAEFTLAGNPNGTHRCAVCDEVIVGPIEFRLRFANDTVLHFDGRCHDAWLVERQVLETP
jgi:hypothetical protein